MGRKGRDFLRRRYPVGKVGEPTRAGQVQVIGEHLNLLAKVDYEAVYEIAERIIKAYTDEQIDSVYVIFNEFKSVISQRLIAQRILPVQEIGRREVALTEEFTVEERERMGEAARGGGHQPARARPTEMEAGGREVRHRVRWTTSTSSRRKSCLPRSLPRYVAIEIFQACWSRWRPKMRPA